MDFGERITEVFESLEIQKVPKRDISKALRMIQQRNKSSFTSTISNESGGELLYNGKKISDFTTSPNI